MSLYTIKVKVNNDLTMLFIVTYHEPNITFDLQDLALCVLALCWARSPNIFGWYFVRDKRSCYPRIDQSKHTCYPRIDQSKHIISVADKQIIAFGTFANHPYNIVNNSVNLWSIWDQGHASKHRMWRSRSNWLISYLYPSNFYLFNCEA